MTFLKVELGWLFFSILKVELFSASYESINLHFKSSESKKKHLISASNTIILSFTVLAMVH